MLRTTILAALLFFAGCSATRPATTRPQPMTGAHTATQAGEATRKAEADGTTGVLVASSNDGAATPPDEPAEPEQIAGPPPALVVIATPPTVDGEEVDLETYFAELAARDPKPDVLLDVEDGVEYREVARAISLARAAGLTRVVVRTEAPSHEQTETADQ